jgi:uncharacterized membrane protein
MTTIAQSPTRSAFPLAKQQGNRYSPPPKTTDDGKLTERAVQTILVEAQPLYELWRNVSTIPRWQEFVVSVTPVSDRVSHWVMGNPEDASGKRIEFDSQITEEVPGKKIAWQSVSEGIDQSGVVTFEPLTNGRGTLVTLVQNVKVPGGSFGNAVAAVAMRSPRQVVIENLRHFKQMAEAGEIPTVKGQPHGPRGLSGKVKEWMYGETNPTPPGTSEQE